MAKGDKNPLTEVVEDALDEIREISSQLEADYARPLFTVDKGSHGRAAVLEWPDDPEKMSAEQMSELVQTRGIDAVGNWLMEHYQARGDANRLAKSEGRPVPNG